MYMAHIKHFSFSIPHYLSMLPLIFSQLSNWEIKKIFYSSKKRLLGWAGVEMFETTNTE